MFKLNNKSIHLEIRPWIVLSVWSSIAVLYGKIFILLKNKSPIETFLRAGMGDFTSSFYGTIKESIKEFYRNV